MRHLMIAIVVIGCGGSGKGGGALTADQIGRACESAYACLGQTVVGCLRNLDDLDTLVSIYRPDQLRCLAAAGSDCVGARACIGFSFDPCSGTTTHCEGDRLFLGCQGGSALSLDCSGGAWWTDDATCIERTTTTPTCGIATCTSGTAASCSGTRLSRCNSGALEVFDCGQAGATCTTDAGIVGCGGTGAACTATRCDGNRLVRCLGGHELAFDCSTMFAGGTCVTGGSGGFSCGFGPSCGDTATCSGNTAQLCVLGAQVSVDCAAAGFAGCQSGTCVPATFP